MSFTIRYATTADHSAMLALMPRLADFDLPKNRNPEHLWQGDLELLQNKMAGQEPDATILIAVDSANTLLGVAIVKLRKELLSNEPSAHLEVLVLSKTAEGQGIGKALIQESESVVKQQGAKTLTLHVFANNTRARGLYERMGFEGEMLRYIKPV